MVPFELKSGEIVQVSIADAINEQIHWATERVELPLNAWAQEFLLFAITAKDRRMHRNCVLFKDFLRGIVADRRSGKS